MAKTMVPQYQTGAEDSEVRGYAQKLEARARALLESIARSHIFSLTTSVVMQASLRLEHIIGRDLPNLVNNYLAMSSGWRRTHILANGKTPKVLFEESLALIYQNLEEIEQQLNSAGIKELAVTQHYLQTIVQGEPVKTFSDLKDEFFFSLPTQPPVIQTAQASSVQSQGDKISLLLGDKEEAEDKFLDMVKYLMRAIHLVLILFILTGWSYHLIDRMQSHRESVRAIAPERLQSAPIIDKEIMPSNSTYPHKDQQ